MARPTEVERLVHGMRSSIAAAAGSLQMLEARGDHLSPDERMRLVRSALALLQDLEITILRQTMAHGADHLHLSAQPASEAIAIFQRVFDEVTQRAEKDRRLVTARLSTSGTKDTDGQLIMFDSLGLRVVSHLLVKNFVRYGTQESEGCMSLSLRQGDDCVVILLNDNGKGINPTVRNVLFSAGTRGSRAAVRDPFGTGRGLHDARSIMRGMGGDLLHQDAAQGAAFECRLAVAKR